MFIMRNKKDLNTLGVDFWLKQSLYILVLMRQLIILMKLEQLSQMVLYQLLLLQI